MIIQEEDLTTIRKKDQEEIILQKEGMIIQEEDLTTIRKKDQEEIILQTEEMIVGNQEKSVQEKILEKIALAL